MAPVTWKNINAPDFHGALLAGSAANQMFNAAGDNLTHLMDTIRKNDDANWNNQARINTEDAIAAINGFKTFSELKALENNFLPAALRASFGAQINPDQINAALADQLKQLQGEAISNAATAGLTQAGITGSMAEAAKTNRQQLLDQGVTDPVLLNAAGSDFITNTLAPVKMGQQEQQDDVLSSMLSRVYAGQSPIQNTGAPVAVPGSIPMQVGIPSGSGVSPQQATAESGGRDFDTNGNILTSPKGAMGRNQVLLSTAKDPGYGIRPIDADVLASGDKNAIVAELNRVGDDYMNHFRKQYNGNEVLALAAYNAGPGKVAAAGNEVPNIPETQNYIRNVLGLPAGVRVTADTWKTILDADSKIRQGRAQDVQTAINANSLNTEVGTRNLANQIVAYRHKTGNPNGLPDDINTSSPYFQSALAMANTTTNGLINPNPLDLSNTATFNNAVDSNINRLKSAYSANEAMLTKQVKNDESLMLSDDGLKEITDNKSGIAGVLAQGISQPGVIKDFFHTNKFHDDVLEGVSRIQQDLLNAGNNPEQTAQIITTAMKLAGAERQNADGKQTSIRLQDIEPKLGDAAARVYRYNANKSKLISAQVQHQNELEQVTTLGNNIKNKNVQNMGASKLKSQPYAAIPELDELTKMIESKLKPGTPTYESKPTAMTPMMEDYLKKLSIQVAANNAPAF